MSLPDWSRNGWLIAHKTSQNEIADLFAVIDRDLTDSNAKGLSADARLAIAYNEARLAATAALAACGYRPSREQGHHHVIQSLGLTIGASQGLVSRFDAFRKKRNVLGYERAGMVSDREADEMRKLAVALRAQVLDWLGANHPTLVAKEPKGRS
jgi:hypothetical protein